MNTLEFAILARKTLRSIPASSFKFEYCSSYDECGCVVHWMFKTGTLATDDEDPSYWDALTGTRLCPPELRAILGFNEENACFLYGVENLRAVTKAQVLRHLEAFIHANS